MNQEVFLSLLALDAYNRGYGEGVFIEPRVGGAVQNEAGRKIGNATIIVNGGVKFVHWAAQNQAS